MEQGKLDEAEAVLTGARSQSGSVVFLRDSRARLNILRGNITGGLDELFEVARLFEVVGGRNPAVIAWRSHAALALLRLGEHDQARRLASEELALAHAWGAPRAHCAALRVIGLIEGGPKGLASLEQAVDVVADSPARLEHAKSSHRVWSRASSQQPALADPRATPPSAGTGDALRRGAARRAGRD